MPIAKLKIYLEPNKISSHINNNYLDISKMYIFQIR